MADGKIGFLPKPVPHVWAPPVKCQGIKTKLVDFIGRNVAWNGCGRWVEPFLGSGVVLFNLCPERALICDTNAHIIRFYQDIQSGVVTPRTVRDFLTENGAKLARDGASFYYAVRRQFNEEGGSLRFLFLNRSCFNGVMRFNSKGGFNVPFGHKPKRFSQAYVTKVTNQVARAAEAMAGRDWVFKTQPWNATLDACMDSDFVYLDPPYIGRHTDYYNQWTDEDAEALARAARSLRCGLALSMWKQNKYRENGHLGAHWAGYVLRTFSHFYHVGPTEDLRNPMTEVLAIRPGFETAAEPETRRRSTLGHAPKRTLLPGSAQLAFVLRDASQKLRGSSAAGRRTLAASDTDAVLVSDKPARKPKPNRSRRA